MSVDFIRIKFHLPNSNSSLSSQTGNSSKHVKIRHFATSHSVCTAPKQ